MRSEDLGILVPHFRIDVELISRDQIGGRAELYVPPGFCTWFGIGLNQISTSRPI